MGGTSVLNGMMFIRGHPMDYDYWAAAGNTGWNYSEVFKYFIKMEDNKQIGDVYKQVSHSKQIKCRNPCYRSVIHQNCGKQANWRCLQAGITFKANKM